VLFGYDTGTIGGILGKDKEPVQSLRLSRLLD